jgi:undecaprenyl-diphosphatase
MPPDKGLLLAIYSFGGPVLDRIMGFLANDYFVPLVLFLFLVGLWFWEKESVLRKEDQWTVILSAISLGIAQLTVLILNSVVGFDPWPRPFESLPQVNPEDVFFYKPWDPSFPSNAAAIGSVLATSVWLRRRRPGYMMHAASFLWAFSRVYVGVHYPLDILGGWAIGVGVSYLIYFLSPFLRKGLSPVVKFLAKLKLAENP